MELLGARGYYTDQSNVFFRGDRVCSAKQFRLIHPDSLHALCSNKLVFKSNSGGDGDNSKGPKDIIMLNPKADYITVNGFVIYQHGSLPEADPATIKVIDTPTPYAVDKNRVYCVHRP